MKNIKLLNTGGTNSKIAKSQNGTEFKIASLSLYPNNKICAGAKAADCMRLCLKDSGFSEMFKSVNEARKFKTDMFMNEKPKFLEKLKREIEAFIVKTEKQGFKAAFRLNTISDIDWIKEGIPQEFPNAFWYDYTKRVKTLNTGLKNYKKIFSYSGTPQYQKQVQEALKTGFPIAVVFRGAIPIGKYFLGREIIDGDKSDLVNANSFNKICGLKLKGNKNKKQKGLFIVEPCQVSECRPFDLMDSGKSFVFDRVAA